MVVIPSGKALGAEIRGIDLRTISSEDFVAIHQGWLDNLALLFRGQSLTDQDLIAFSNRFGDLDWAPCRRQGGASSKVILRFMWFRT